MAMDVIDYKLYGEDMQFVEIELDPNEAAIGEAGAANAGILAASMLANTDDALLKRLDAFRKAQTDAVAETVEDGK